MDVKERLNQLQQAHAQHVQLMQQTQANIIKLEGAMGILQELAQEAVPDVAVPPNRKARRANKAGLRAVPAEPPAEPLPA